MVVTKGGVQIIRIITEPTYVHFSDPDAAELIGARLKSELLQRNFGELVIACIGTDRSTGDSLGPLVGTFLSEVKLPDWVYVYGTLDEPMHAMNLCDYLDFISRRHRDALVLAVDALLGRYEDIGLIDVRSGPLKPGAGVGKRLPPVGDLSLTGVVNAGGFMEHFVLQSTRLSMVMRMARVMATAILYAVWSVQEAREVFDLVAVVY